MFKIKWPFHRQYSEWDIWKMLSDVSEIFGKWENGGYQYRDERMTIRRFAVSNTLMIRAWVGNTQVFEAMDISVTLCRRGEWVDYVAGLYKQTKCIDDSAVFSGVR
ncbi:MAG TPA: hypothetical protein VHV83_07130 [Armatimonadota bacterium]|nr:hypothetical protein [Armatimonadota bacterium]